MTIQTPLALDERAITQLYARNAEGAIEDDDTLDAMKMALASADGAAQQLAAVVKALSADTTMTADARSVKARQTTLKLGDRAAKALEAGRKAADEEIARLTAETAAPSGPEDEHQLALEQSMIAALRQLSREERNRIVGNAIRSGDERTVHAVLSAPAWLSGFNDTELELKRGEYQGRVHPQTVARLRRLRKGVEATERAGRALVAFVRRLADNPTAVLAEAAAQAAADALAKADADTREAS
jgi:hypothetical protein